MSTNIEVLLSRLKSVRKNGKEWVAHCPAHDDSTPSLGIKLSETGKILIHCMADCAAADILAAVDMELADLFPDRKLNGHVQPAIPAEPERITSAPGSAAPTPVLTHPTKGKPTSLYVYRTVENMLLGYVMRFDTKEGKTFCPYTYSNADGWQHKAFSKPRPLYGLQMLRERSGGARFIVEGEKAADALAAMTPGNAVLSWCGGAGAAKYADLSPLAAQPVILWPDADAAGHKAVAELATRLHALGCQIRIVDTSGLPDGFDAADLKEPIQAWLRPRLRPYAPAATPDPAQSPAVAAVEPVAPPVTSNVVPITEARTLRQAKPDAQADAAPAQFSHDALAQAFTAANPDWRYVAEWGKWLCWNGTYWARDTTNAVKESSRLICRAAAVDAKARDIAASTIREMLKVGTISAVETIARSDPGHARASDQWDADPWLLNTPGGIVDLRDGSVRPGRPEDHQTRITRATPGGNCPTWVQFLIDATNGDGELIGFLQRMAGYCLTGSIRDHALFFVHGPGGNGKGTFLNTLTWIFGDYAGVAAMDTFTEQHQPQHKTELASLMGRRLVSAQEVEEGKRWAEARINALTGGDPITANFMRQDLFTFMPQFKLIVVGNHKPIFRNVGDAIRRRLHLIPFTHKIEKEKVDKLLAEKLREEADGILRWAVAGCIEWQRIGLQPPEIVLAATDTYLSSQDTIGTWMAECCDTGPGFSEKVSVIFGKYRDWCEQNGEPVLGRKRFTEAMTTRGHPSNRLSGSYWVAGVRVRG